MPRANTLTHAQHLCMDGFKHMRQHWSPHRRFRSRRHSPLSALSCLLFFFCRSEHDCFEALQEVRKLWPSVGGRVKDYISSPKPNGYRAVHDTLLLPCGTQMEVQVRTCEMHAHAEEGLAAHRQYKGLAHTLPRKLLRDMASIAMPQRPAFASPLELAI